MALMRTLFSKIVEIKQRKREAADIWKLYHFLHFYKQAIEDPIHYGAGIEEAGRPIDFRQPDKKLSVIKMQEIVHTEVTEQLKRKLLWLQQQNLSEINQDDNAVMRDMTGYKVSIINSKARGSIPGVQLEGFTPPGSIVCFFPGTVFPPESIDEVPEATLERSPHLMQRSDGSIVDASDYEVSDDKVLRSQPMAVGHLTRHPPLGVEANVMPYSYNLPAAFPKSLLPLIPNRYNKPRSHIYGPTPQMLCLLLVTTRSIRDEELFLNYRLNPASKLPDWYHSINKEEDKKRWK